MDRHRLSLAVLFALCAIVLVIVAAPAVHAQHRPGDRSHWNQWSQPMVADTVLNVLGRGSLDGETLYLPPGERISIEASAVDQDGRPFPQERFRFGFDLDSSCGGLVQLEDFEHGTIHLRTADRTGTCNALFWVPNNMNLDRPLQIEVGRRGGAYLQPKPGVRPPGAYGRGDDGVDSHNVFVATSVFEAILGREADNRWLSEASAEVGRGHTRDLIRSLLDSPEFRERRSRLSPDQLLESFYRGLLGRDVDPSGQRNYIGDVRNGHYEGVIVDILGSEEYRQRLAVNDRGGARHR